MHRGNVLVKRTKEEFIYFRLNHKDYNIKSYGVRATIVDFTLSRVTQKGVLYRNKKHRFKLTCSMQRASV